MRFGRRRKTKEKQRAAWDAVAATLETPPPVSSDDLPVAPAPPPRADDSAFTPAPPVAPQPVAAAPVAGAPVAPEPAAESPATVAAAPAAPLAPPPTPEPVLPAAPPPPPAGPPVFRFTPTGTTEVPTAAPPTPAPPVAPAPPLTLVPDPEPAPVAPPPALAVAPPLAPTAPIADITPAAPPPDPIPDLIPDATPEPTPEPPPVAPSRVPDPHSMLPVVVAPSAHLTVPPAAPSGLPAPTGRVVTVPQSTRAVADRMRDALDEMVQLSMRMDAWMDQAVEMRTQLLSEWDDDMLRPSYTDFVVRAVARALVQHPELNAVVRGDSIELLPRVHVGITLPGRDGIDIPVVRDADRRTLRTIAAASRGMDDAIVGPRSLAAPADTRRSDGVTWHAPDDSSNATMQAGGAPATVGDSALDTDVEGDTPASFVVASLGIYGVDAFTPIVMTPNVATLAIGRVRDATRWEGDTPTRASAMTLTLAWDHRAVDGTTAAEFLAEVRDILEQPYRLLVD